MILAFRDLPAAVRDGLLAAVHGSAAPQWHVRIYEDLTWHKAVAALMTGALSLLAVVVVAVDERNLYAGWAAALIAASAVGSWLVLTGCHLWRRCHVRLVPRAVLATPFVIARLTSEDDEVEIYPVAELYRVGATVIEVTNRKTGRKHLEHSVSFMIGTDAVVWSDVEGQPFLEYLHRAAGLKPGSEEPPGPPSPAAGSDPSCTWPALLTSAASRPATPAPRRWPLALKTGVVIGLVAWLMHMLLSERDLWYNVSAYPTSHQCSRYARWAPFGWHRGEQFDDLWAGRLFAEALAARTAGTHAAPSELELWKAATAAEEYLRLMPTGKHRKEITALRDDTFWAWVGALGRRPGDIGLYLDLFPEGLHASEARRLLVPVAAESSRE